MERNQFKSLPQLPEKRLSDMSEVVESPSVQQNQYRRRDHPTRPDDVQPNVQEPHVPGRVSQRQFQESVMLIRRNANAQNDSSRSRVRDELKERAATNHSGPSPHSQQQFIFNNTPLQTPADDVAPEAKFSESMSTGPFQKSSRQGYVEKLRQTQKVHSKTHLGDISGLLEPQASQGSQKLWKANIKEILGSNEPYRRRELIRQILGCKGQCQAASDDISPLDLQNQQTKTAVPNWPFGVDSTSSRNNISRGVQHYPLTMREIRLLLGNTHIRNGNMGHLGALPTPEDVTPPQPPPHVHGITPEPQEIGRVSRPPVRRLTGLRRRNAQRRSSMPPTQQDLGFLHDRSKARFRRGRAARDVRVIYSSPVELARRKSILPQIQEAVHQSSDSETTHELAPEDPEGPRVDFDGKTLLEHHQHQEETEEEARQKDKSPQHSCSPTERQDLPTEQKTQRQRGGSEPASTSARPATTLRRFSLVVKGPRRAPARRSVSSSTPHTPSSSASPNAATQTSSPISEQQPEPEPDSESKHLAHDGPWCGTAGCTWPDCSRIRGTFKMPVPGGVGEDKSPEGDGESAAEGRSEDDLVSVGNGFFFLRLN